LAIVRGSAPRLAFNRTLVFAPAKTPRWGQNGPGGSLLKGAVRSLVRQPAVVVAAVATLALGIAAPTAMFSTVNAVLLKPLPYPHPEDLYTVRTYMTNGRFTIGLMASEEMLTLQRSRR
jgi:hypothetical protein